MKPDRMSFVPKDSLLVTIITPTYNRASFLDETIRSVLSQDYQNIEYIVLDDGSTDNTSEVLRKYEERIVCERHDNIGEQHTVNKGFHMAKGELVCFVNSDDPLYPGAIRSAVVALQEHPDAVAAYPDWNEINAVSKVIRTVHLPEYDIRNMLTSLDVSLGPGLVFWRKLVERIGLRDSTLTYAGDLDFYFRLALNGRLIHIPQVLATHREHGEAASTTGKGGSMADQLVKVIYRALDHPDLPSDMQRQRRKILGRIHYIAAKYYCGTDVWAKFKHLFLAAVWKSRDSLNRGLSG